MAFHLAETEEEAHRQAVDGLQRWHNEYNVWTLGRAGATHVEVAATALTETAPGETVAAGATHVEEVATAETLSDAAGHGPSA